MGVWRYALWLPMLAFVAYRASIVLTTLEAFKDAKRDERGRPYLWTTTSIEDASGKFRTLRQELKTDPAQCETLHTFADGTRFAASGFEDIVMLSAESAVTCAGNLDESWYHPEKSVSGQCVMIEFDTATGKVQVKPLAMENFPSDVAFFSHGIDVVVDADTGAKTLFVVNHAYHRGGERIETFALEADYRLRYLRSLTSPLLREAHNGVLNDLTVTSPTEFYVTSYLPYPDPVTGRTKRGAFFNLFATGAGFGDTNVLRCVIQPVRGDDSSNVDCTVAASGFMMANGITHTVVHGTTVFAVADPLSGGLTLLTRCDDGTLCGPRQFLRLAHAADNVQLVKHGRTPEGAGHDDGEAQGVRQFYLGSIYDRSSAPTAPGPAVSPGGVTEITLMFAKDSTGGVKMFKAVEKDIAMHDGRVLPGTASGMVFDCVGSDRTRVAIAGSYREHGLMVCRTKRDSA